MQVKIQYLMGFNQKIYLYSFIKSKAFLRKFSKLSAKQFFGWKNFFNEL